jgi:hypothetical protein
VAVRLENDAATGLPRYSLVVKSEETDKEE